MRPRDTVRGLLGRYGQTVELEWEYQSQRTKTKALIQPILEKNRENQQYLPTPMGVQRLDRYLYLGLAEIAADKGMRVHWGSLCFSVQTAHPIYIGDTLCHWWGVLIPEEAPG